MKRRRMWKVSLYRWLAEHYRDAYRPDLAASLHDLAADLRRLGRLEESLAAIQEAVTIHRRLVASQPDAYRPNLAGS